MNPECHSMFAWCCPRVSAPVRLVLTLRRRANAELGGSVVLRVTRALRLGTPHPATPRRETKESGGIRGRVGVEEGPKRPIPMCRPVRTLGKFSQSFSYSHVRRVWCALVRAFGGSEPRVAYGLLPPIESDPDMRALRSDPRWSQSKRVFSAKRDASAELRWRSVSSQPTTRCGCH